MWHDKRFDDLRIYQTCTHKLWMVQVNKKTDLDNEVKWNKLSQESSNAFSNGKETVDNPISQPGDKIIEPISKPSSLR